MPESESTRPGRSSALQGLSPSALLARVRARFSLGQWRRDALEREQRLREEAETLVAVSSELCAELQLRPLLQKATDAATRLAGARYGAFTCNTLNSRGEPCELTTVSGLPAEGGFGPSRETDLFGPTFRGEKVLRLDDLPTHRHYRSTGPPFGLPPGHAPVRSYLAVPVTSRTGEVLGGLFFGHPDPGVFTARAEQLVRGIAAQAAIAIDNSRLFGETRGALAERERAESAARGSEQRYRHLIEGLPAAIYTCDATGKIELYNEAAVTLWGRVPDPGEEWCGSYRIYRPDGSVLPLDECPMAVALRTGRPVRGEEILVERPDGSRRNVLPHPEPILDDSGAVTGAINMLLDITDRKAASAELTATKDDLALQVTILTRLHDLAIRLAELQELSPALQAILAALVEVHGAQSGLLTLRDATTGSLQIRASLGVTPASLGRLRGLESGPSGSPWGATFHSRRRMVVEDLETDPRCELYRAESLAAGFRAIHSTPIETRSGETLGVLSVQFTAPRRPTQQEMQLADMCALHVADAIQASRSLQALRDSEAQFRTMADHAPVLIWLMGMEGCEFVNRSYLRFVGCPFEELRGSGWESFVHPEDSEWFGAAFREGIAERQTWAAQYRLRRADGEYRWVQSTGVPRFDPDGSFMGFVGCSVDITDIKRSETALLEADLRKDEFLAILAHELRNPLAPLRNSLDVLRQAGHGDADQSLYEMMDRQLNQLVRLVDDLLEISRITSGKIELRRAPVALSAVIEAALETSEPLLAAGNHQLTVNLPPERIILDADAVRLSQVFSNLLNNAAKYTPSGGGIEVTAEREGREVVVTVRDNGVGIPPPMLPRVFDLFAQMNGTIGRVQGGIGIGLTLVRRLVELHGGSVQARSAGPGEGSEFTVRLPLDPFRSSPAKEALVEPMSTPLPLPLRRILIVDDNPDSADSLGILLRLRGATVEVVHDGPAALALLESFQPAVVLLDLGMPGMDGFEVAQEIRRHPKFKEVVLVAQTGWGNYEFRRRSQEVGFDHHLVKPLDIEALACLLADPRRVSNGDSEREEGQL